MCIRDRFSRVRLFVTPWTRARQALLSSTASRSCVKFMLVASMTLSNHRILCRPLLLLPSHFPNIRVFSRDSSLLMRWPKYWSLSFRICPSSDHSGFVLLALQNFLLLLYHSSVVNNFDYSSSVVNYFCLLSVQLQFCFGTTLVHFH